MATSATKKRTWAGDHYCVEAKVGNIHTLKSRTVLRRLLDGLQYGSHYTWLQLAGHEDYWLVLDHNRKEAALINDGTVRYGEWLGPWDCQGPPLVGEMRIRTEIWRLTEDGKVEVVPR